MSWSARQEWAARLNAAQGDPEKALALWTALGPDGLARGGDLDWARAADAECAWRWRRLALSFDAEGEARKLEALGGRLLVHGEPGYPASLLELPDAPVALYVLGTLAARETVAVVGTRTPTPYGRRVSRGFARRLAAEGHVVLSGLARGIDSEAHLGALDEGGPTWAVLGNGLGELYPPENRELSERIPAEGGALLSEFPVSAGPRPPCFLRRNRIVAGLSRALIVVEGRHGSGAVNTAGHAAQYSRELFAVPGPIDSPLSEAPNRLIRDGVRPAASIEDVLAALPGAESRPRRRKRGPAPPPLEEEESRVLAVMGSDSLSLDELMQATGLDSTRLSLIMFGLEIKEVIFSAPGQRYAKRTL